MNILVTGVAGFIGSNLARRLINQGYVVYGIDNFLLGSTSNLKDIINHRNFRFSEVDLSKLSELEFFFNSSSLKGVSFNSVWHLAANSDIKSGTEDSSIDLANTFLTTFNLVTLLKKQKVDKFIFASSSAVYGDFGSLEISENFGPLMPISNYGAMKLASEAIISASLDDAFNNAYIFRFPNVIGTPATHGVIYDFINKLKINPDVLHVLGDGNQQKNYLHVEDLIDAMIHVLGVVNRKINILNIGNNDDGANVRFIAEEVVRVFAPNARIEYEESKFGWKGDVPKVFYSTEEVNKLGWRSRLNSKSAIKRVIEELYQESIF